MTRRVRTLKRAVSDLVAIRDYVARDAPAASDQLIGRLLDAIEGLAELPERGTRPRDERLRRPDYRFLVEGSYLVFYKIVGREVRVYRVVHCRRAYQSWL